MANRYWVGGTGSWSNISHWSAISGGAGGASIPTSADNAYFDANSFTIEGQTVTIDVDAYCLDFVWTGALYNPTLNNSRFGGTLTISGSLTYVSGMNDNTTLDRYFVAPTEKTIDTKGVTINCNFNIEGIYKLAGNITFSGTNGINIGTATFDTNNYNINCNFISATGTEARTIKLGSSIISCNKWTIAATNVTLDAGTSTIKVLGNSEYFQGGNLTYNNVEINGDIVSVMYSNTFNNLKLTAGKTVKFQSGKTQTITSFTDDGAIIESTVAGSPSTISCASGIIIKTGGSLKDIPATGGATFRVYDGTDISGNTGWGFYITANASIICTAIVTCSAYVIDYAILKTGLTTDKGSFFKFNGILYYMQNSKYYQYDGETLSEVVPYIPTVIINRTPTGGGDVLENYNRIGKGFINKFNGNNSAVAYTLTDSGLDATTVTCTVDGVTKTEGTHFTVNRTTGIVTFTVAPPNGTNNVVITAYKTVQADIDSILKCKYAMPFGGQNDNRLFVGGNGTGYFYWTDISANGIDASYFAYNNYNIIGNSDEDITGFKMHYETLCIFKEKEIHGETYTWDGTKGIFSTYTINPDIGCDCPDTLQGINNNIVWLTSYAGPQILLSSDKTNKRNVQPLGRNINPKLLKETNLKTATSVDYNGHYWICVNDKVYLWNYFISPYVDTGNPDESAKRLSWWYFDNVNALKFITDGQTLYYAHKNEGKVVKFVDNFVDFDNGIESMYRIPLRDFGNSVYEFDVLSMWVDVRSDTRTEVEIAYVISDESSLETETDRISVGSFSIPGFSIPTFTLDVMGIRQTFVFQPLEKKIDLFGVEFTNSAIGRDMNISNVVISYNLGKRKR